MIVHRYYAGKVRVPFFAACGDMREICRPDNTILAVVPEQYKDAILNEFNGLLDQVEQGTKK